MLGLLAASCGPAKEASSTPALASPTAVPASGTPQPTPTAAPHRGGSLRRVIFNDPSTFDIQQASSVVDLMTAAHLYNNLLWNPTSDAIQCDVCSSWQVQDGGKSLVFSLLDTPTFADGHHLTASDVKYSLEKMMGLADSFVSPRAGLIKEYVQKVEAPDPRTVVLRLDRPAAALPSMLAMQFAAIYRQGATRQGLQKEPDGTGPFRIRSRQLGASIALERNPTYFKPGLPYLDSMDLIIIGNPVTGSAAFLTNNVDIGQGPSRDTLAQYEAKRKAGQVDWLERPKECRPQGVMINSTRPPFDKLPVRQAINLAIDRWGYIEVVHEGRAEPALVFRAGIGSNRTPSEIVAFPGFARGQAKEAEREQARQLLAQAGFPKGLDVVLTVRNAPDYLVQGQFIAGELAKVGVRTTLEVIDVAALYPKTSRLDYALWPFWFCQTTTDPDEVWAGYFITDGSRNWLGYSNKELDQLFVEQSRELDPSRRAQINRRMEDLVMADLPFAPTADNKEVLAWWTHVGGYAEGQGLTTYTSLRGERWWRKQR